MDYLVDSFKLLAFLGILVWLPGLGLLALARLKADQAVTLALGMVAGIAGLTLGVYGFGYLGWRTGALVVQLGLAYTGWRWVRGQSLFTRRDFPIKLVAFLLLAALFQSLVIIGSGRPRDGGFAFWGVQGHDGIWHATLIQELAGRFPPQNPAFAGVPLQNYHYFFDLFAAEIHRVAGIPVLRLYFQYLPLAFSFFLNGFIYLFATRIARKTAAGYWAVFLYAAGSSFGHLLPLVGLGSRNWETAFWAMQTASSLQNPPFFFSLILLAGGLLLLWLHDWHRKVPWWLAGLIFGVMIEFKVYGGLLVLAALLAVGLWQALRDRRFYYLKLFGFSALIAFVVYWPANHGSGSLVVWEPFWFPRVMIQAGDRVNWVSWELRRQVYQAHNNRLGLVFVDAVALGLFLLGNFGLRAVGFLALPQLIKEKGAVRLFLWALIAAGIVTPLLFLQKYLPWNTIQFFYYSLFGLGIFAALVLNDFFHFLKRGWQKVLLVVACVLLAVPPTLMTFSWHWTEPSATIIEASELEALTFLRNQPGVGTVLVYPHEPGAESRLKPPVSLAYYNAAYVSFFSGRPVYLEDETAARIQGYGFEERLAAGRRFFTTEEAAEALNFLRENRISHLYLVDNQSWKADLGTAVREVYRTDRSRIYEVVAN